MVHVAILTCLAFVLSGVHATERPIIGVLTQVIIVILVIIIIIAIVVIIVLIVIIVVVIINNIRTLTLPCGQPCQEWKTMQAGWWQGVIVFFFIIKSSSSS